ncbi:DEAD/DEAH box helicase [Fodinicurvata sp. EGI_FJ10296]|uniref:DEAD/DEAH box helicase n=1 Tax=Fodinicurvata sp. EGI_FJ10296 TaxID=3231908 RepID=UPI003453B0E1
MTHFTDLGLAEPILRAVTTEGYTTPTPIQAEFIPAMLSGRDIVGVAQTGTGKTAAFVLPLLNRIAEGGARPQPKNCTALILAPTRELANQIADNIRTYGRNVRHSVALIVGGAKPGPQIRAVARGADIVVATPGRLLDHMSTGAIRLDRTTTVILDEADQMMDLGFMPAIRRILATLPAKRQTALLSATMPKPIRALAADFLTDPVEIAVTPQAQPIERIEQKIVFVNRGDKSGKLVDLLSVAEVDRAIVFTRTKHGADKVARHLQNAGLSAGAIHGNKTQSQRERTLAGFRAGRESILVATDIAARGIDVDGVSHVVNFDLPNVPESYVHRIGRTARAGNSGIAISLCDGEERGLLRDIQRLIGYGVGPDGVMIEGAAPEPRPQSNGGPRGRGGKPGGGGAGRPRQQQNRGGAPRSQGRPNGGPGGHGPAKTGDAGGRPRQRQSA